MFWVFDFKIISNFFVKFFNRFYLYKNIRIIRKIIVIDIVNLVVFVRILGKFFWFVVKIIFI